ncbi:hypothetical protein GGX14DRAFT_447705 [Mycena pura]|uniref:Uncharacterized protein n=1 Tax=Mycena pura TaxID=153505 RepID=A0AAD6VKC9_9AGAR|nr:hypothetical protein GGX14DRAFT_447705 [Mycena pura]
MSSTATVFNSTSSSSASSVFTFLATLILLVVVICSVVVRAIFVRRHYRRRVDRALAHGLVLAPLEQGSHELSFGAKPKLFDPISVHASAMDAKHADWTSSKSSTIRSQVPSESASDILQVSVIIAMPADASPDSNELPDVALGLAHAHTS